MSVIWKNLIYTGSKVAIWTYKIFIILILIKDQSHFVLLYKCDHFLISYINVYRWFWKFRKNLASKKYSCHIDVIHIM